MGLAASRDKSLSGCSDTGLGQLGERAQQGLRRCVMDFGLAACLQPGSRPCSWVKDNSSEPASANSFAPLHSNDKGWEDTDLGSLRCVAGAADVIDDSVSFLFRPPKSALVSLHDEYLSFKIGRCSKVRKARARKHQCGRCQQGSQSKHHGGSLSRPEHVHTLQLLICYSI